MTIQPGANLYTQGFGSRPEGVEVPHYDVRDPSTSDVNYPIGKRWINTVLGSEFSLVQITTFGGTSSANWIVIAATGGAITSLTTDDSTVVTPTAGNINVQGTASEIVTTGGNSPGEVTIALSSSLVLPGTLTVAGTTNINTTGSATTNIGTSTGTGNVNIGNAVGSTTFPGATTFTGLLTTQASANIRTGASNLQLGTDSGGGAIQIGTGSSLRTISIGNGSGGANIGIGAGVGTTSITLNAGSGGIIMQAGFANIKAKTGAAGIAGTATLTSGTVTVATTAVTASSLIYVSYNTPEASPGHLSAPVASISAGVHFVINSTDATDSTSTVNWFIIN